MRHFVTVSDGAFLPRLKALHASMVRHCGEFTLNVLPWDDEVQRWTESGAAGVVGHAELAETWLTVDLPGPPRSLHERMWSARADLTWTLVRRGVVGSVLQLDADLFFFASPEQVFADAEATGATAGVMPHYFARAADGLLGITHESHAALYGEFNSGSVFMRDAVLARRWAKQTREWCYFRTEDGKFADQGFMRDWLDRGAVTLPPWAFPGPWTSKQMGPYMGPGPGPSIGGMKMVSWHFSSLRISPDGSVTQYANPEYALTEETIRVVYEPYVTELRKQMGL